jgi:hypothetical protein
MGVDSDLDFGFDFEENVSSVSPGSSEEDWATATGPDNHATTKNARQSKNLCIHGTCETSKITIVVLLMAASNRVNGKMYRLASQFKNS